MVLASTSSSPESDHTTYTAPPPKRLTIGFVMTLMAICAKHASRISKKLKTTASIKAGHLYLHRRDQEGNKTPKLSSPKSPLVRPKHLLTQISNKAITLIHHKKRDGEIDVVAPGEFGDGGVWQKAILMGDKCQPLDFSGVIYYDSCGKQVEELPIRSPRASPLPGYLARGN